MKYLVTGDIHLNDNPRDEYRHTLIAELPKLLKKLHVDKLIILGDLTTAKDRHSAQLVNRVVDHLHAASDVCEVIVLQGNHDYATLNWPFFTFVDRIPNIEWISRPTAIGRDVFLPHTNNYKVEWKGLKYPQRYYFAHNTFHGAESEHGQQLSGIPLSVLEDSRIISGDVHVPQVLRADGATVTYVGAPYTINFGDEFEPRMLLLEAGKITSVPMHGPRKRVLEITAGEPIGETIGNDFTFEPGDILKIKVNLRLELSPKWQEFREGLYNLAKKWDVVIDSIQPVIHSDVNTKVKVAAKHQHKSDADLLRAYAKRYDIDNSTLNVGLKLLEDDQ